MASYTRADHLASIGTGFEPQRQSNFSVEINFRNLSLAGTDLTGIDVISLSLVGGFLPTNSNEPVPISYGNEVVYVAGKSMWEAGQLVLRDWVDRPTARILTQWRTQVYNPRTGSIGLATNYKTRASIILFPPNTPDIVVGAPPFQRVWTLEGCWPQQLNLAQNGLDQTTSGLVNIGLVLRFDKAFNYGEVDYSQIL